MSTETEALSYRHDEGGYRPETDREKARLEALALIRELELNREYVVHKGKWLDLLQRLVN